MKRLWWIPFLFTGCVQIEAVGPGGSADAEVPGRVQQVFDTHCATSGCHDATTRAGGLSLNSADSGALLSGAPSNQEPSLALVRRGSVQDSYLAIKVLAEPPAGRQRQGARMPLGDSADPEDIALLLGWVAGADLTDAQGGSGQAEQPADTDGEEGVMDGGSCSVEALAASGVAPIDAGLTAEQIPEIIGEVVAGNCGCHLAEMLVSEAEAYRLSLPFDLTTLQGWRATVQGREAASVVHTRVVEQQTMPPAYACDDGSGATMTPADRDLLADWIADGLPGGDAWP